MSSELTTPGILVPLDGSPLAEQVLRYAQALLAPGAALTLLEVVEEPEPTHGMWVRLLAPVTDERDMLERLARDDLKRAEDMLRGERPAVRHAVVWGDPAEQIIHVAVNHQVGLIAMTTHGRGALGRWVFGSVADRVARASPVPVFLLRPSATSLPPTEIRRLVVPLDGSALAKEALPTARSLATRLGIPLHLITVVDILPSIPTALSPVVAFDAEAYEGVLAEIDADATAMLTAVREPLDRSGLQTSFCVLRGSPFSTIAAAVQEGDLIIMTSHGRGRMRRWLLGSVAEKLVREAPVPVILVPVAARQSALSATTPVAS
jgi:nucleotide-binding universal stress UspA family protein